MSVTIPSESVSRFFGLSYNHYLVVPRSLLQSMPAEWQANFVALLDEMVETGPGHKFGEAHYYVRRTDPGRDGEIHDADIHNQTHDCTDAVDMPEIKFVDDPFKNYRHPSREVFGN